MWHVPCGRYSSEARFHREGLPQFFVLPRPQVGAPPEYVPPPLPCKFVQAYDGVLVTKGPTPTSPTAVASKAFLAVARVQTKEGLLRLQTDTGVWVTEHSAGGR
jgi:hypothetical protein